MARHWERQTSGQVERACHTCNRPLYYYPSEVRGKRNTFCSRACLGAWRSKQAGASAAHWANGTRKDRERVLLHLPWHPSATANGYVARSRIVAELVLRRPLEPGEVVHHIDHDPSNDHPDNLLVLDSQSQHIALHREDLLRGRQKDLRS